MLNKKAKLLLTLVVMTLIWLLSLSLPAVISNLTGIAFMVIYIVTMVNALREPKQSKKAFKVSPTFNMKKLS